MPDRQTGQPSFVLGGKYLITTYYVNPSGVFRQRWGKVAATSTVTHLIAQFGVDQVIFTRVADAVDPALNIGDIVIAGKLYQHDMDALPLFTCHEIP